MDTITLTKPDGTKFQVNDRRRQKPTHDRPAVTKTGHWKRLPNGDWRKVNNEEEPEPLLPLTYSDFAGSPPKSVSEIEQEQRDETRPGMVKSKRPVANDEEPLYPIGIEIEED